MPVSHSILSPQYTELSPMRVNYKGVDLGGTLGNVKVTIEAMKAPILMDQLGKTEIDNVVSGHKFLVVTELTEIRLKDNWKVVFPWMNEVTSGGNKMMYADSQIGRKDTADAGVLILHPLSLVDADLSGDYKFFVATSEGKAEPTYGPEGQVKLSVSFKIYPDFTVVPQRFMIHGDPTIGLIAAIAAAAVAAGGNVGNGTVSAEVAYSGFTKTETITLTAVTAIANSGVFEVHGSISGPLGLATVGTNFVSPVISFLINDGATDFAVGDQFTIATTAANYV